jgi:hypothetical protein
LIRRSSFPGRAAAYIVLSYRTDNARSLTRGDVIKVEHQRFLTMLRVPNKRNTCHARRASDMGSASPCHPVLRVSDCPFCPLLRKSLRYLISTYFHVVLACKCIFDKYASKCALRDATSRKKTPTKNVPTKISVIPAFLEENQYVTGGSSDPVHILPKKAR